MIELSPPELTGDPALRAGGGLGSATTFAPASRPGQRPAAPRSAWRARGDSAARAWNGSRGAWPPGIRSASSTAWSARSCLR